MEKSFISPRDQTIVEATQRIGYDPRITAGSANPIETDEGSHYMVRAPKEPEKEGRVFINPRQTARDPLVFQHEYEHKKQDAAGKRYAENKDRKDTAIFSEYLKRTYNMDWRVAVDMEDHLKSSTKNEKIREHLTKLGLLPYMDYYKNKSTTSLAEILADLAAPEQAYGFDWTKDPVMRKELFKNDERLMDAYRANTGLRTDRLDAKDIAPYSTNKTKEEVDKLKTPLNPFWKDPFTRTIE